MIDQVWVIGFTFGYLAFLFAIAWFSEKSAGRGRRLSSNPYIYALSLAVYCTAWTYYGSVGRAASNGLEFLTIYIGPSILAPVWWIVMRKMIRISKVQRISSIADFISSRYGKDVSLGGLVTLLCLMGLLPYISIQIKAISSSFSIFNEASLGTSLTVLPFYLDTSFYLAIALALFTILFGTRNIEATSQHEGLVMAVAFESVFKLVAFLFVGVFVTYFVYDGFRDVFEQAAIRGLDHLFVLQGENSQATWFWMTTLSMMAILFLPRQFQMGVVENTNEKHLDKAMWLFPLYLLLINLFVFPIALGGLVHFPTGEVDADTFVLAMPIAYGQGWLALLVYLGGFSAATSMIIVSTIALSNMVSNNLIIPSLLTVPQIKNRLDLHLGEAVLWIRRISILLIVLLAYLFYRTISAQYSLVYIGLISFVAIAQFTPAIIGGMFWKSGSRMGALTGIVVGFLIWFYTLVVPTMVSTGYLSEQLMTEGLWGIAAFKPQALLGMSGMDYISHGLFFSLFANALFYVGFSLFGTQTSKEHNQAVVFVDIFKFSTTMDSSIIWKGQAYLPDLKSLLARFFGEDKTDQLLNKYYRKKGKHIKPGTKADSELVNYSERLLTGIIGAASARILVASVVKEEEISMEEVLGILKEAQQLKSLNVQLEEKSRELKQATEDLQKVNEALRLNDMLKDEFISTVTHEMKTPITSIRAFSEILMDDDLPEDERKRFLDIIIQETKRMSRLIDQVLDLERFDSGRQELNFEKTDVRILILESVESMFQVFKERDLKFEMKIDFEQLSLLLDEDRIKQVLLNLLSNASKFAKSKIILNTHHDKENLYVEVLDDGPGVPEEEVPYIFDKFFQAKNQTSKKPIGSGLGLAISKKIMDYHQGSISVSREGAFTCFRIHIPHQIEINHNKSLKAHEQDIDRR